MDDPQSTWALLVYAVLIAVAWVLARTERYLALRSQSAIERLSEQVPGWGVRFLSHSVAKRRILLAIGLGHLVARVALVGVVFIAAHRLVVAAVLPWPLAYLIAGVFGLIPLSFFYFVLPGMKTVEEIGPGKIRLVAPIILLWTVVLWPLIWLLDRLLVYLSHQPESKEAREEALIALVENDSEDGILEADTREMISSILDIDDTTVKEVMIPRVDVVAIERTKTVSDLLTLFIEAQHSRIPVYEERLDNIIGIVHAKDVLRALVADEPCDVNATTVDKLVREAVVLFVPTTKKLDDLLKELRREKKHMAVVVDEYGGTAGLITMEDILEEIVGEIQDEYDEEEETLYTWISDHELEVDASMDIADLNEIIAGNLPDENGYETLGGFLYHQFSAVPEPGARTEYDNFTFVVKSIEAQRITKVLIELKETAANHSEAHQEQ